MPSKKRQNPFLKILELNASVSSIANINVDDANRYFDEFKEALKANGEKRKKTQGVKSPAVEKIIAILEKYPELEKEVHGIVRVMAQRLAPRQEPSQKAAGKGRGREEASD